MTVCAIDLHRGSGAQVREDGKDAAMVSAAGSRSSVEKMLAMCASTVFGATKRSLRRA